MDRIELEDNGFPFSAASVRFMQSAQASGLTNLCKALGNNFIAWGCEVSGGSISAGAVVVDGEIIPFAAGAYNAKFKIEETSTSVTYQDQVQRAAYFTRVASCSANGSYTLANFPRMKAVLEALLETPSYTESEWVDIAFNSSYSWTDISRGEGCSDHDWYEDDIFSTTSSGSQFKAKRTADGTVRLIGGHKRPSVGETPGPYVYATLPEGFRPSSDRMVKVTWYTLRVDLIASESTYTLLRREGYATVKPNGDIVIPALVTDHGHSFAPLFSDSFHL